MKTPINKAFNATAEGQRAMCADADKRALAFILNRKVKSLGGIGWDDSWITSANDDLLISIKEGLVQEYNSLVTKQ